MNRLFIGQIRRQMATHSFKPHKNYKVDVVLDSSHIGWTIFGVAVLAYSHQKNKLETEKTIAKYKYNYHESAIKQENMPKDESSMTTRDGLQIKIANQKENSVR